MTEVNQMHQKQPRFSPAAREGGKLSEQLLRVLALHLRATLCFLELAKQPGGSERAGNEYLIQRPRIPNFEIPGIGRNGFGMDMAWNRTAAFGCAESRGGAVTPDFPG